MAVNYEKRYRELYEEHIDLIRKIKEITPKWHDLRENPADLPSDNREVIVYDTRK